MSEKMHSWMTSSGTTSEKGFKANERHSNLGLPVYISKHVGILT